MKIPQFSLSTLLSLTGFVGIAIAALMKPSVWWAVALPSLLSILLAFAIGKVVLCSGRQRAFWASFFVGTVAYLALALFVKSELHNLIMLDGPDIWEAYLGKPLWDVLHDPVIHDSNERRAFRSFVLSLHIVIAIVVSALGASISQLLIRHRGGESASGAGRDSS